MAAAWGRDSLCARPALIGPWARGSRSAHPQPALAAPAPWDGHFWRRVFLIPGRWVAVVCGYPVCSGLVDCGGLEFPGRLHARPRPALHAEPPGGKKDKSLLRFLISPRPSGIQGPPR